MKIKRYDLGRDHAGNVGCPAIIEQAEGEYVRYDDYKTEIAAIRAESEIWRNKLIKAEGRNADATT